MVVLAALLLSGVGLSPTLPINARDAGSWNDFRLRVFTNIFCYDTSHKIV